MKKFLNKKGFSLVELMVVVAIIGILASVALPKFQTFQRKARTTEAKVNLHQAYTVVSAFGAENSEDYTSVNGANANMANFGFKVPTGNKYTYAGKAGGAGTFTIGADAAAAQIGCATGTGNSNKTINQDAAYASVDDCENK